MSRKVFISFLGTTSYKKCIYGNEDLGFSSVVTFVQDAILQLDIAHNLENNICYFFFTNKAYEKHGNAFTLMLSKYNQIQYKIIQNIPEGFSEKEIWQIFNTIIDLLEDNDNLTLDITHGFRSLPMLTMTLLSYAKSIKNITVSNIYYGAFEALGEGYKIEEIYPDPMNRRVPLLNLTTFSLLQEWSNASLNFFQLGNSRKLVEIMNETKDDLPFLSTKQKNRINEQFVSLAKLISDFSLNFSTNRGKEIISNTNVNLLQEKIDEIKSMLSNFVEMAPLIEILNRISDRFSDFKPQNIMNGFEAVKWCIESEQIQPAITLLQEFTITKILADFDLDYNDKNFRNALNGYFNLNDSKEFIFSTDEKVRIKQDLLFQVIQIEKNSYIKEIKNDFTVLTNEYRNDIQHAGFGRNSKTSSIFLRFVKSSFNNITTLLNSKPA